MKFVSKTLSNVLIVMVKAYQWAISPFLTPSCRYSPSCSEYTIEGLKKQGIKAVPTVIKRILSCHPWGSSGYDPFPCTDNNERTK